MPAAAFDLEAGTLNAFVTTAASGPPLQAKSLTLHPDWRRLDAQHLAGSKRRTRRAYASRDAAPTMAWGKVSHAARLVCHLLVPYRIRFRTNDTIAMSGSR